MDVNKDVGLRRAAWNLRADPPASSATAPQPGARGAGGFGGGRGRGGPPQGPLVAPGRYRATLGKQVGDTVTPLGPSQSFTVVQILQ